MNQALPKHLLHNPFCNRFNDPVTHRRDEMPSYESVGSLRQPNATTANGSEASGLNGSSSQQLLGITFVLLLVLLVSVSMLRGL